VKVLTVILALLVIALSVMPCCFEDACATDEVLTEQTDSHESDAQACSPFYSCASCFGFTVSDFTVDRIIPLTHTAKPIAFFKQGYMPPFPHAIWQPPKIS
jgi:hypothetical protein